MSVISSMSRCLDVRFCGDANVTSFFKAPEGRHMSSPGCNPGIENDGKRSPEGA